MSNNHSTLDVGEKVTAASNWLSIELSRHFLNTDESIVLSSVQDAVNGFAYAIIEKIHEDITATMLKK